MPPPSLEDAAGLFRLFLDNVREYAVFVLDTDGCVTEWGAGAEHVLGYTAEEAVGAPCLVLFTEEDRAAGVPERELEVAARTGQAMDDRWHVRKGGDRFWANGVMVALRDGDGELLGFAKVLRDKTEQKAVEDALRESEEKYRTLFDSIDEGFCVIEVVYDDGGPVDYRFLEANPAFEGQTGLTDAVGKRMRELSPTIEEHWVEAYGRVAETGRPERFAAEAAPLGRWFDVYAFRVGDPTDRRVAVLFSDVTAQREAEAALAEASRRTGEVLESISDGFFALDRGWRFTYVNAEAGRLLGRKPDGLLGDTIWEAFPEAVGSPFEEHYRRAAETGQAEAFEAYFPPLRAHYAVRAFPFAGGLSVYFRDVTDEKRAEGALRESEEKFRAVADLVPDLLWRASPSGERVWGNRRWAEYTGQTAEEAAGFGWAATVHPDDRDRALLEATGADGPFRGEHRLRRADGAYRWFLVNAAPVLDDDGRVAGWFGSSTDVHLERTARETLEARVEERTAQVRELARALTLAEQTERRRIAYVLHDDLQQRLYGLELTLSLLRRHPGGGEAERLHEQAERTLAGATALTRSLSHEMAPPLLRGDDLEVLLEWVADRKRDLYGLEVDVEVRDGVTAPDEAVRTLLYQLVQELLFNVAKHAGTDRAWVVAERDGEEVRVTVEDEGAGFDLAALEEGTGLGLPSVRERLELVGGRLAVDSVPGAGTRVTLTVPRGGPRASGTRPAGTNSPTASSGEL